MIEASDVKRAPLTTIDKTCTVCELTLVAWSVCLVTDHMARVSNVTSKVMGGTGCDLILVRGTRR